MKRLLFPLVFPALLLLPAISLSALDWGLMLNQEFGLEEAGGKKPDPGFSYAGTLSPWVSLPLGTAGNFYLSAGATVDCPRDISREKTALFVPELYQTELKFRFGEGAALRAGRTSYADPLGFIASGLFDGAHFSMDALGGTVGAGIWYTGLLYKKTARITMTALDALAYSEKLDYSNFAKTYCAPSRLLWALDWSNPYVTEWLRLKTSLVGQFDLSGREHLFHSQYLAVKAAIPVKDFVFDLGGCFELAEAGQASVSLAGELGAAWSPPARIENQLALLARFTSGTVNHAMTAFVPITTEFHGDVLRAKLSGISMIRLDYTARLSQQFLFNLASSYFALSDLVTYQGLPAGKKGNFLGNEFYGRVIWAPVSDLRINFGGGVFLPSLGNADNGGNVLWRIDLGIALVIF